MRILTSDTGSENLSIIIETPQNLTEVLPLVTPPKGLFLHSRPTLNPLGSLGDLP